jgi:hypothetical protein
MRPSSWLVGLLVLGANFGCGSTDPGSSAGGSSGSPGSNGGTAGNTAGTKTESWQALVGDTVVKEEGTITEELVSYDLAR